MFLKKILLASIIGALAQSAMADGMTKADKKFIENTLGEPAASIKPMGGSTPIEQGVSSSNILSFDDSKKAGKIKPAASYPSKSDIYNLKSLISSTQNPFEDTKQAVFQFDPNQSYPIVTRAGQNTYIDMPDDVTVQGFYLSKLDDENWIFSVTPDKKQIAIQPTKSGIFDSASIVTNKYKMILAITSTEDGQWFQNVKWVIPKKYADDKADAGSAVDLRAKTKYYEHFEAKSITEKEPVKGIDADSLNTKWSIEGDAPFKPLEVYNDSDFTWLVMPPKLAELPALFSISVEGKPELTNYIVAENGRIKVTKVLRAGLLKIGKQEVKITNLSKVKLSASANNSHHSNQAQTIMGAK